LHPTSSRLWFQYLNLRQTDFASFTVSECLSVFGECIQKLTEQDTQSTLLEPILLHIQLRVFHLLWQSGLSERAIALLQAQIELSSFCPIDLKEQDIDEKLVAIEEWWEDERPRFGEKVL